MIQLLFLVLLAEGVVALLLVVKIGMPTELAMTALDQLRMGKGPATIKTLACTMSAIWLSSIISILKMRSKSMKLGTVSPVDQVLWRTHLLEASLIGYTLFLALVINRLHHYLRKIAHLQKTINTYKDEVENLKMQYHFCKTNEEEASKKITNVVEEIHNLTEKLQNLKSEYEEMENRALSAESHVLALQRQSETLLLEYDRLLADNQILQSQSQAFKCKSLRR
ncbi:hypothetical protein J5N97_020569 [Dioscorea zingiberensis]|uniref:Endoplasmic reticulum transmembrane protein n=1 Tax=Dioscorea zingiberensis TaxID=325984 RepID=A0A9D5CI96_9LILI|nr:hypothetical protein J5N97_020569 [Dioscorea zingiberensis]